MPRKSSSKHCEHDFHFYLFRGTASKEIAVAVVWDVRHSLVLDLKLLKIIVSETIQKEQKEKIAVVKSCQLPIKAVLPGKCKNIILSNKLNTVDWSPIINCCWTCVFFRSYKCGSQYCQPLDNKLIPRAGVKLWARGRDCFTSYASDISTRPDMELVPDGAPCGDGLVRLWFPVN